MAQEADTELRSENVVAMLRATSTSHEACVDLGTNGGVTDQQGGRRRRWKLVSSFSEFFLREKLVQLLGFVDDNGESKLWGYDLEVDKMDRLNTAGDIWSPARQVRKI